MHDREILPLVAETLDRRRPRNWYYALMDYGAMLKTAEQNPNRRSKPTPRKPGSKGQTARFEG